MAILVKVHFWGQLLADRAAVEKITCSVPYVISVSCMLSGSENWKVLILMMIVLIHHMYYVSWYSTLFSSTRSESVLLYDHWSSSLNHKQNCQKRKFVGIHGSWSKIMYARILKWAHNVSHNCGTYSWIMQAIMMIYWVSHHDRCCCTSIKHDNLD